MKELKSRRGFGPFVAKNYWRILHCFGRSQLPDDLTYAECGPGAREFLLLLHGHPGIFWFAPTRRTLQTSSTHSSSTSGTSGGADSYDAFGRPLIRGSFIGSRRSRLKRWSR